MPDRRGKNKRNAKHLAHFKLEKIGVILDYEATFNKFIAAGFEPKPTGGANGKCVNAGESQIRVELSVYHNPDPLLRAFKEGKLNEVLPENKKYSQDEIDAIRETLPKVEIKNGRVNVLISPPSFVQIAFEEAEDLVETIRFLGGYLISDSGSSIPDLAVALDFVSLTPEEIAYMRKMLFTP